VLEGEALGRHLIREAISMPSACHQSTCLKERPLVDT
jgi:hypothetical protein